MIYTYATNERGEAICDRCDEPIKTRGWRKGMPTPEVPQGGGLWTHPPANGGMFCDPIPQYR